jgi:hypothetical protein
VPTATLKLFLVFGEPKLLRAAKLSNWTGKAVAGPRSECEKVLARDESLSSEVYLLTGTDPATNKSAIYIGAAECLRDRVKSHLSKDFWNTITFFVTCADWVSIKVDSVDDDIWRRLNRPHKELPLARVQQGMGRFVRGFSGELVSETMLLGVINRKRTISEIAITCVVYRGGTTRDPARKFGRGEARLTSCC